jgi:hypothetical protein
VNVEPEGEGPGGDVDIDAVDEASVEEVLDQLRELEIAPFLVSIVSTLASLAYGKLEADELDEARVGIDAMRALVPILKGHLSDELQRELEQVVANLQVAYANAVSSA